MLWASVAVVNEDRLFPFIAFPKWTIYKKKVVKHKKNNEILFFSVSDKIAKIQLVKIYWRTSNTVLLKLIKQILLNT